MKMIASHYLDPSDWTYVAEGGKHVVFAFRGESNSTRVQIEKEEAAASRKRREEAQHDNSVVILRIQKKQMIMAVTSKTKTSSSSSNNSNNNNNKDPSSEVVSTDITSCYATTTAPSPTPTTTQDNKKNTAKNYDPIKTIIRPSIGPQYIDLPSPVYLPTFFVKKLYFQTKESGVIPKARMPSWTRTSSGSISVLKTTNDNDASCKINTCGMIEATMLKDYTIISPYSYSLASLYRSTFASNQTTTTAKTFVAPLSNTTNSSSSSSSCISIEIKPKAGYLSKSPLIDPKHACKHYKTRFYLQQYLMKKGRLKKGWQQQQQQQQQNEEKKQRQHEDNFEMSSYSPLHLFSNDLQKVERSIKELMDCMQNNLKVWYNGSLFWSGISDDDDDDGNGGTPLKEEEEKQCRNILHSLFPTWFPVIQRYHQNQPANQSNNIHCSPSSWKNILQICLGQITAKILLQEPLLAKLLHLQQLDVIDADGAVLLYQRLVSLCGDCKEEAEDLLGDINVFWKANDNGMVDNDDDNNNDSTATRKESNNKCSTVENGMDNSMNTSKKENIKDNACAQQKNQEKEKQSAHEKNKVNSSCIIDNKNNCPSCSGYLQSIPPSYEKNVDEKKREKVFKSLFVSSPYNTPPRCPILYQLCCEILKFRATHFYRGEDDCDYDGEDGLCNEESTKKRRLCKKCLDTAYQCSKTLVGKMSKEGCVYLLQNWLLSLSICDVSFFVTVCPFFKKDNELRGKEEHTATATMATSTDVEKDYKEMKRIGMQALDGTASVLQGVNSPGVVTCCISSLFLDSANDNNDHCHHSGNHTKIAENVGTATTSFLYQLKVIDCDLKPACKLRGRNKSEDVFRFYAENGDV